MSVTIHIPHWLLWVGAGAGAILIVLVIFFAVVGFGFLRAWGRSDFL